MKGLVLAMNTRTTVWVWAGLGALGFGCGEAKEPPAAEPTELIGLRTTDQQALHSYDQVDAEKGVYQLPVARAIEVVAADPQLLASLVKLPDLEEMTPIARGEYHFNNTYACAGCHLLDGKQKLGPHLNGRFGGPPSVLESGESVAFDEAYFNESVLNSRAKMVKGFPPIMPVFEGRISTADLDDLRAFLKTTKPAS
jgi:cytochrome c2